MAIYFSRVKSRLVQLLLALVICAAASGTPNDFLVHPWRFGDRCAQNGFAFETHQVVTEDGFILQLYRIPGKLGEETVQREKLVYLQHGLLDSADSWVSNVPELAPAFRLSREGYDVWLGNTRGNKYSHSHLTLDPRKDRKAFFDYSFTTMGAYDITAEIDYILARTGKSRIAYIGHSQGTSQFLYAMSANAQWVEDRISVAVLLAPIIEMQHTTSPLLLVLGRDPNALDNLASIGYYEFLPKSDFFAAVLEFLCKSSREACKGIASIISEASIDMDNPALMIELWEHFPSGSSLKSVEHYVQLIKAKRFQEYDYGEAENERRYGQKQPPLISFKESANIPVALLVGTEDRLSTVPDVKLLHEELGERTAFFKEYYLGHLSFMIDQKMEYFDDVLTILRKYED